VVDARVVPANHDALRQAPVGINMEGAIHLIV
jgi:hypothetical protein